MNKTKQEIRRHLRWLAQKDLLGQDCFLLGPSSPFRRWLALAYCEIGGREVEFLSLSRDTTESDLKQVGVICVCICVCVLGWVGLAPLSPLVAAGIWMLTCIPPIYQTKPTPSALHPPNPRIEQRREIQGGSAVFVDQAPVRAAVGGRVLLLEGMEKAERNVLPLLNSLLENREMPLEDGRFLLGASGMWMGQ